MIQDAMSNQSPLETLRAWWEEAVESPDIQEPAAAVLATVDDKAGLPDARILLVKDFDADGLTFVTNLQSRKGRSLATRPAASLVFLLHAMLRQVRVRGPVVRCTRDEDETYWSQRSRQSQLASWSSLQSRPAQSRQAVLDMFEEATQKFGQSEVPLPEEWGGYRLQPIEIEFWVGMPARLHDRLVWRSESGTPLPLDSPTGWRRQRLQP